ALFTQPGVLSSLCPPSESQSPPPRRRSAPRLRLPCVPLQLLAQTLLPLPVCPLPIRLPFALAGGGAFTAEKLNLHPRHGDYPVLPARRFRNEPTRSSYKG